MVITQKDKDVLRGLAEELAKIAALPVQKQRAAMWRDLNDLKPTRPLIWANELPWHEMNINDELTLRCQDEWAKGVEWQMRQTIYQWRHCQGDMIVSDYIASPLVISTTGLGISEDVDIARTDPTSDVVSRHFHLQITKPEDIEKIKDPVITHDVAASERNYNLLKEIVGGIMPVQKVGIKGSWFAPWDELVRLWGVQEMMMDLVMRPQMVNDIMTRTVDAYLAGLDQWEKLNLLTLNTDNTRVGSGGYAYVSGLPGKGFDPAHVRTRNMFGSSTAQIFSEISPEMHWEFAVKHEMRWLERWGLTYYGCCEPLDLKMDVLRRIPNLRKISMSPWIKPERAAKELSNKYVFSYKPNPAFLAEDGWRPQVVRDDLQNILTVCHEHGCCVEIILKDVSTIRYKPERLTEWMKVATEVVEDFAP